MFHELFDRVINDGHSAVADEHVQRLPVIMEIAQGFGEVALGKHFLERARVEPVLDRVEDECGLLLPQRLTLLLSQILGARFHVVQRLDHRQQSVTLVLVGRRLHDLAAGVALIPRSG